MTPSAAGLPSSTECHARPTSSVYCSGTQVDQFAVELDRALRSSRTLPALPNWWQLEVPSRLGSLYFFWGELAAQQPRESLEVSLAMMTAEWNDVLERPRRTATWVAGVSAVILIAGVVILRVQQRTRARAEAEIAEAHRIEQEALYRERMIEHQLDLLRQDSSRHEEVKEQILLALERGRSSIPEVPRQFAVTLSSSPSQKLTIERNGKPTGDMELPVTKMVEYVLRQSLLHERPIQFSIVTAAMCLWSGPRTLLKGSRLESIVAGMRRAFDSKVGEVITKARDTVYGFTLAESEYQCRIIAREKGSGSTVVDYATDVRDPFIEASRVKVTDPAGAFTLALSAFAAEAHLIQKDVEVVLLVCELSNAIETSMSPQQQTAVDYARRELQQVAYAYKSFFETHTSLADLLQRCGGIPERGELVEHWEGLNSTWKRIQNVIASLGPLPVAPNAIKEEWADVMRLLPIVESKAFRVGVKYKLHLSESDDEEIESFNAAFARILEYWGQAAASSVVMRARISVALFGPEEKIRKEVEHWAQSCALEHLGNLVLDSVRAGVFPDHERTTAFIEASLVNDFKRGLQDKSHVLLKLLDSSATSCEKLRTSLLAEEWPSDFASCLSHAHKAAVALRGPQDPSATGADP